MITEDYVSFETAKLLKEKGFNEHCDKKYYGDDRSGPSYITESWEDGGDVISMSNSDLDNGSNYTDISAPTLQMAMKWLRKTHHLEIYPFHEALQEFNNWWFRIERHSKGCSLDEYESELEYNEYEDACEAAIKYCLEHLI